MEAPVVRIEGLNKTFDRVVAVSDFNLDIFRGEIVGLLGPSGCGKTTTLRCVAGLEQPSSGIIRAEDRIYDAPGEHLPTERRGIGMVFQSYALWPHLTVQQNVEFPLSYKKDRDFAALRKQMVDKTLALLNLPGLARRYPAELSGGQQQRVAVARALVTEPRVLLFDEPFSNLDAQLRNQLRIDLRLLLKRINATALYVTHDQREAMALCDRIVIMEAGAIRQVGTPYEIYKNPADLFVANFMGDSTTLSFAVENEGGAAASDQVALLVEGHLRLAASRSQFPNGIGDGTGTLVLRPDALEIQPVAPPGRQSWAGVVIERVYLGLTSEYVIELTGSKITLTITALETGAGALPIGAPCAVVPRVERMLFYPSDAKAGEGPAGK